MKTIIIYNSQTGFTKQYAQWLAEEMDGECISWKEAKKKDFASYDTIIFGSWFMGGSLVNLNWFKEKMSQWSDKKLVVYGVGASPIENPEIEEALGKLFTEEENKKVSVFYCPGGLCYEKMNAGSKLMMKMFVKMMQKKKDKTEKEETMAEILGKSYDISDKKYIEPIKSHIACF